MGVQKDAQDGVDSAAGTRLYRVVHGWPMLLGLPAPLFLGLAMGGVTAVFGASMIAGLWAAGAALVGLALVWAILGWLFSQDQVALPLFVVRRRLRLLARIASYSPSPTRVRLLERGGA